MAPPDSKLEYFIKRTESDFKDLKDDIESVKKKIDQLWQFRSILVGAAMAVSLVVSFFVNLLIVYFDMKK